MIKNILLVGLGGAVGSILRYLTSALTKNLYTVHNFPAGTFLVNMLGCFLVGLLIGYFSRFEGSFTQLRLLLIIGFCGGFTTFSSFSAEGLAMIEGGHFLMAAGYIFGSILLGLGAVWAGLALAK